MKTDESGNSVRNKKRKSGLAALTDNMACGANASPVVDNIRVLRGSARKLRLIKGDPSPLREKSQGRALMIKTAVESGTYRMDAAKVAERMIERFLERFLACSAGCRDAYGRRR